MDRIVLRESGIDRADLVESKGASQWRQTIAVSVDVCQASAGVAVNLAFYVV